MGHKKLTFIILVLILVTGVASVSARASDARSTRIIESGSSYSQAIKAIAQAVPVWEQVNSNGFGDPQTGEVTALEVFNGYLYAGTHNPIDPALLYDGAQIFRSSDGMTWTSVTQPGFGNSHDIAPPAILDFVVFNNQLYASTGRGNASQIWRTSNGTIWAPMDLTGFSDPDNVDVTALAVYNNMIYAGVTNQVTGAQIWSSFTGDNNSWTQVAPDLPGTAPASITGFAAFAFDGGLYAAIQVENTPVQIWRSYGSAWEVIVNDGFGDANTLFAGGMTEFLGNLYVGAGNAVDGAQLWRTIDGTTWEQIIAPGFGDTNNQQVETVYVFQNQLYASVRNTVTGIEIWRSADGVLWEQANTDGFGDSNNTGTNWSNATSDFISQLYVGTLNIVDGGELWRTLQQLPDTPTATSTSSPTSTATGTSTFTATNTLTYTPTNTLMFTPTNTPTSTSTNTATATSTFTPTFTLTNTPTNTSTSTPSSTATGTSTFTATNTLTYTPTNTLTFTPANTPTNTLTFTPIYSPTYTATATRTDTPASTPTFTATYTPTFTPTLIPTPTPRSSTPGKITGGGNIDLLGGKATFGFVIKYVTGNPSPSGNLTFIDHSGKLNLKAISFDFLMIEGNQAWFAGKGIINDGQIVEFEVSIEALSKQGQPGQTDTFHIYIPAVNGYMSGGTLNGGNITIHK